MRCTTGMRLYRSFTCALFAVGRCDLYLRDNLQRQRSRAPRSPERGRTMQRIARIAGAALIAVTLMPAHPEARAAVIVPDGSVKLEDVQLTVPDGWRLAQDATNADTLFARFV